ncbi:hypothetical protein BaRGS_00029380 [Batillaria attramentaria]|uniref:Uncharacterized protein n=1 Tax=Batillaria attramentaria TaxID=370345 RepID=A0ABD0JWR7_9CAEN
MRRCKRNFPAVLHVHTAATDASVFRHVPTSLLPVRENETVHGTMRHHSLPNQYTVNADCDSVNNSDISTPINKDVSSFYDITCSLCDVACDSCTGNGPGNCSACAEEHTRDHSTGKCVMKKEDRGQSIALIGGVAGGGVTIAALVVMAIVCCCRRQQPHRGGVEVLKLSIDPSFKSGNTRRVSSCTTA